MVELLEAVASWQNLLLVVLVFGFAPRFCLRLIVLAYPRSHQRRAELIAELETVPPIERPLWVAEQLEVALFEGLAHRLSAVLRRFTSRGRTQGQAVHDLLLGEQILINLTDASCEMSHESLRVTFENFHQWGRETVECWERWEILRGRRVIEERLTELKNIILLKYSVINRNSVDGSLARLRRWWSDFEHGRAQSMVADLPLPGREKMTDLSRMIDAMEVERSVWGEGSVWDFHVRLRGKVCKLIEHVRSVPALRLSEGGLMRTGEGVERLEEARLDQARIKEHLRSFEPVKERLARLCDEVKQAEEFVTTANAALCILSDIKREWNQTYQQR